MVTHTPSSSPPAASSSVNTSFTVPTTRPGPLIRQERGFRRGERNPRSGGMGGVEMVYNDSRTYAHAESYPGTNGVENRRYGQWWDSPGAGSSTLSLSVPDRNRESNRRERGRPAGGQGKVKTMERTLPKSCFIPRQRYPVVVSPSVLLCCFREAGQWTRLHPHYTTLQDYKILIHTNYNQDKDKMA